MYKLITLLFIFPFALMAQSDESLIKKTIDDYLEGGTNGDVARFKSAFVDDAIQRSIGSKGTIVGMTVESLSSKIKPGSVMNRTTRLVSWSYAGIAATAITETTYPNSKIIDLLNLLKVGNDWKIVSRVYSRIESDEEVTSSQGTNSLASPSASTTTKQAPKKKPVIDDGW